MRRKGLIIWAFLTFIVVLACLPLRSATAATYFTIDGAVMDEGGGSIQNADILVFKRRIRWRYSTGWERLAHRRTGPDGVFSLSLEEGVPHLIVVYHDDPVTAGFDHLPFTINVLLSGETDILEIELLKGATIKIRGEAYFVETSSIPDMSFTLLDPVTGDPLSQSGLTMRYGSGSGTMNDHLDISSDVVIAPADTPFTLKVHSNVKVEGKYERRDLTIEHFHETFLESGSLVELDLREFFLPSSLAKVQGEVEKISSLAAEKEAEGFFIAVERQRLARVHSLVDEAEVLTDLRAFEKAYTSLREAYVELSNLENWLVGMTEEASRSIAMLIAYMAVSATVISVLLFEDRLKKVVSLAISYAALLWTLFMLHPGSQLLTATELLIFSAVSIAGNLGLTTLLPLVMRGRGRLGQAPLRNMVIPVLSIAKRSLRRRRLRLAFTLTSVIMLVASFIALTSFTTGYGLTFNRLSRDSPPSEGILIRTPDPPPAKALATFSGGKGVAGPQPLEESVMEWFRGRPEVIRLAPKYENNPQRQYREIYQPFGRAEGFPIFGVMAISPSLEAEIHSLDQAVVGGKYLDDEERGIMISANLAEALEVGAGDTISLSVREATVEVEVVGLLDDEFLDAASDLDGESILPRKIVELERIEQEGPDVVLEGLAPCVAEEVIVTNLVTAPDIPSLWLNRLDVILDEGADLKGYARMMALNRGFRAWASTDGGVYLAQLAGYFEGKGLPITVPWIIVVLNVVATMLNSYYERRREVMIYSSIGMNPRHISSIFLTEAAVIGIVGGSTGYILGLGTYRLIYALTPALQVKQKISAIWSLAALVISLAAVLVGGLIALSSSVVITPSRRRRWSVSGRSGGQGPSVLQLPVKVSEEEVEEYVQHLMGELRSAKKASDFVVRMLHETLDESGEKNRRVIEFVYSATETNINEFYTRNQLVLEELDENIFTTTLVSQGNQKSVQKTGSFIRRIVIDWSMARGKRERR